MNNLRDALMKGTRALPAAASSTVDGAAIQLDNSSRGHFPGNVEFKLNAPAVNTTMAPDTRTFTYSIIHSDNADLSSPSVLMPSVIVQTGAGGAGAAAASYQGRLPANVKKYVGARVISGASTADASSVAATLELLF
jgi:hypothetical protein